MNPNNQFEMNEVVYRHGDVLLKKSSEPKVKAGKLMTQALLYKGANHHHRLKAGSFKLLERKGARLLDVRKMTTLDHEEHGPIKVAPGVYVVDVQQEYDHFLEESRAVID